MHSKLSDNCSISFCAEVELFEKVAEAETLADFIRIGINRLYFEYKGNLYDAWDMAGDNKVNAFNNNEGEYEVLDGSLKARFSSWDFDEDGHRIAELVIGESDD